MVLKINIVRLATGIEFEQAEVIIVFIVFFIIIFDVLDIFVLF